MTVPTSSAARNSRGALRLRWDILERRFADLGVDTDVARGQLLGVTRQTIGRWRHGRTGVSLSVAMHLADVLGVRLEQLISTGGDDE